MTDPSKRTFRERPRRTLPALAVLALAFAASGAAGVQAQDPAPPEKRTSDPRFFRKVQFLRGDVNADGAVDISDSIRLLELLFFEPGAEPPPCLNASDANTDNQVDLSDAVHVLGYLFLGSATPDAPGPDECGVDRREDSLPCDEYPHCPDDFLLISHVLGRITFGPTEELYTEIQTRADLVRYIEEQLAAPPGYDPSVHEPRVFRSVEDLQIGFRPEGTPGAQRERLKAMLLVDAARSRWQLLHVIAHFWNNHFHTQAGSLQQNFFGRPPRGGGASPASDEAFDAADRDGDGAITQEEWSAFRDTYPSLIPWEFFGGSTGDGVLTREEFRARVVIAYWKYRSGSDQLGVAADMERREYDLFRRLAFGRFRDLLEGSAKSVAMLIYLNGFENTVLAPNENYAREFLELFSAGADHMYTQRDIEELSKVFTGWTVGWVRREGYAPDDTNFQELPGSRQFPLGLRHPPPLDFPDTAFRDDAEYTWAFVFGARDRNGTLLRDFGHDWGRKDLFLERYGGVDSLGNPVSPADAVRIPARESGRTIAAALEEFELVLDRVVGFRDTARFISTKLIQLLVTDDLSALEKTYETPPELLERFRSVDRNRDGRIVLSEWLEPIPLVLPNGRPPGIFAALDTDGDGRIAPLEYQEPDLLLDAIDAWRASGGSIREVLRAILLSDEFLSLKFRRAKVKTPFELVAGAVRGLQGVSSRGELIAMTRDMSLAGMELFDFVDPTGESELGFDWMHTVGLLERLKFLNRAADPASPDERRFRWNTALLRSRWDLLSAERTVDLLSQVLHAGDVLESHRQLAIDAYGSATGDPVAAAAAFLVSLPAYQKQ